jgi:hypothetical protein
MTDQTPVYPEAKPYARDGAAVGSAVEPKQVTASFWLYIAAAALSAVSLIVTVVTYDQTKQVAIDRAGSSVDSLPAGSLDPILTGTLIVSMVFGVLFLAANVVFAVLMKRGHGWARWVLGAITVFSLFSILSAYGLGAGRFVLGAIATVLVFLSVSSQYFRSVKAAKK